MELFKNYLKKRNKLMEYSKITRTGSMFLYKIDKMGNARLLKPSIYQVDETIKLCEELRITLIKYLESIVLKDTDIDYCNYLNELKNMNIDSLIDCKVVANKCFKIGTKLERKNSNLLIAPILPNLTLIEALILVSLLGVLIMSR